MSETVSVCDIGFQVSDLGFRLYSVGVVVLGALTQRGSFESVASSVKTLRGLKINSLFISGAQERVTGMPIYNRLGKCKTLTIMIALTNSAITLETHPVLRILEGLWFRVYDLKFRGCGLQKTLPTKTRMPVPSHHPVAPLPVRCSGGQQGSLSLSRYMRKPYCPVLSTVRP